MAHPLMAEYQRVLAAVQQTITHLREAHQLLATVNASDELDEMMHALRTHIGDLRDDIASTCWREIIESRVPGRDGDLAWRLSCGGDEPEYVFAEDEEQALVQVRSIVEGWAKRDIFAYADPGTHGLSTAFYDVQFGRADWGKYGLDKRTLTVQPPEPVCTHPDGHNWKLRSSGPSGPSPRGEAKEVRECLRCGMFRHDDEYATHPMSGEQGFHTITFRRN